ncbi:MAG: SDR family NAD(P)-dependent oxidoreductase [Planctomycetota bacterium]
MNDALKGRVAVITGAGTGIGKAITHRLAREGIKPVLCSRNLEKLEACAEEVKEYGVDPLILQGDLTDDDYLFSLMDRAGEHFGKVDIIINNAGMALNRRLEETSVDDFDRIMRLNVRSTYFACQTALKWLRKSDRATIINISSCMGHKAYADQSAYIASKHAVHGLTKSLAKEVYEEGIRCHLISPGGVYTDMVAIARPDLSAEGMIAPEEIAEIAAFYICHRGNAVIDEIQVHRIGKEPFA